MHPINRRATRRQRGSVIINTTIALSLLVIVLVGVELGYLFFLKRELQKTADLAAIAGAQALGPSDCSAAQRAAAINGNLNLPAGLDSMLESEVICGHWDSDRPPPKHFGSPIAEQKFNAVLVTLTRTPTLLLPMIPGNAERPITVEAVAAQKQPLASLTIRNTLVAIDDEKSPLLNAIFGGLLGGNLDISALGWSGLINTDIRLLDFLDQLKIALDITAGGYDQVLNTQAEVGTLLDAMVVALGKSGQTADIVLTALGKLHAAAQIPETKPLVKVADLLNIETGTAAEGLKTDIQLFQLISGIVQLAGSQNAAAITLDVPSLAGITASVKIKIVEPPQVSAVGNPNLIAPGTGAGTGIADPNKIYVRTSQIRALISVDLNNLTNVISELSSTVTAALSPIVGFLNTVSTLNIGNIVTSLVGGIVCGGESCPISKVIYTTVLPSPIDINISSGNGDAYVTDHTCITESEKTLSVHASTSVAQLNIGKVSDTVFSSSDPVITAAPVPIVEIGYQEARYDFCILNILLGSIGCTNPKWRNASGEFVTGQSNGMKHVISGLGLRINSPIGATSTNTPLVYSAPAPENLPEIDAPPFDGTVDPSYKAISSQSIVGGLGATLAGIQLEPYASDNSGILGGLLSGTVTLINSLLDTLESIIKTALRPLLDPVLNKLLDLLGIDLSKTEVSGRLSCNRGAALVY